MSDKTTRPNEHDVVRVKGEAEPGTVVHIYPNHVAYEVEFDRRIVYVAPQDIIPDIGVCQTCDGSSVPPDCFGNVIEGELCLGCGAPVHELLKRIRS